MAIEFEEEFKRLKYKINKLKSSGIGIDPFDYDFVYSHIPVGTLKKPPDDFDYSRIYTHCCPDSSSFYIHIPFCINNCRYCFFPKKTLSMTTDAEIDEYIYLLKKEFLLLKNFSPEWGKINSIYIGGGTPSILNLNQMNILFEIVDEIKNNSSSKIEIAIELHPGSVDKRKVEFLIREKKVTRISFGIQTFNNSTLKRLNRDNEGYEQLINYLREMRFENWNIDLIYGSPFQTFDDIKKDLEKVIKISPPSITWYQLWYKPRKKEKNIILEGIKESQFMNKEDILYSRLYIYYNLIKNEYKNISENWFVKDNKYYTKYEEDKIKSAGNIGIGLGAYQAYGNYIFENFLDWDSYRKKIESNKLPIQWIREMLPSEIFIRKTVMGLKGLYEPEPIILAEFEKFKHLSKSGDIANFFTKISQLEYLEIMEKKDGKVIINSNYHLIRDYLISYLLRDYGWCIEKEGVLESFSGLNVWEAKEKIKDIFKDIIENEPYSISFFIAIFSEEDKTFKLNISKNYIKDKKGIFSQKESTPDFFRETKGKFSFLKKFYLPPTYLKEEICITSGNSIDNVDLISINIDNIENEILNFLKLLGLDYSHIEKDYDYVKSYYSSKLKKWLNLDNSNPFYVYHIPLFPEFGVGGIEIATTKCFERDRLQYIKQTVIGFFTDRLSREINKYEKFRYLKYALRSAVAAIMARNKSHIHGSHIEHGLRNRIDTFEKIIISRLEENKGLYKRIEEIYKIKLREVEIGLSQKDLELKKHFFITFIKDEAQKRLSFYRQRQDDLSARMATEWPQWGCSLDFYTHLILPIKQNPLVLHFINLSDGYGLKDTEIKFGYYKKDAPETLTWVEEFIGLIEKKKEADLVDFAVRLLNNNSNVNIGDKSLSEYFDGCKFQSKNRQPFLINLKDADIGAQAFFALFEGIIRNASKHGQNDNNGHRFKIKIVGCYMWEQISSLVDFEEDNYQPNNPNKYKYILISVGCDLIKKNGNILKIGDKPLIQALRDMASDGIIDDTGKIIPGNWGIKEMKICASFVAGKPIEATQEKSLDYFHIGKSRGNKIWKDGKERICYVVRFERPGIALAIVPNNKKPQNPQGKEWEGVRFVDHPDNIFDGEIDYDFLYVDNSWKGDTDDLIRDDKAALPQRVVYGDMNFKSPALNNILAFGCQLYDEFFEQRQYIMVPNQKQEINLRIYFDDDELAKSWKDIVKEPIKLKSRSVKIDIIMKSESECRSSNYLKGYQLCLCRHKKIQVGIDVFEKNRIDSLPNKLSYYPFYAQHFSASNQFFNFLISIRPKEDEGFSQFLIRQIIEATLLNVLIIDERISESLYTLKAPDEPGIPMAEKLYWMGISVAKSLCVEEENIWKTPREKVKTGNELSERQIDRLVEFILNEDGKVEIKENDNLPIHILFIHATRLNEIYDKLKGRFKNKEEIINIIKINGKIPYVIVHSGRGKTEGDIPDNAPFVEYSTLERYVLSEPSKFYLIQIALSAKGEKK